MTQQHPQRCETCENYVDSVRRPGYKKCKISNFLMNNNADLVGHVSMVGCASHSSASPAPADAVPKFSSEDLLLLAHDEFKRRQERKHTHEEGCWIAGFINGFCTDRKWARDYIAALRARERAP